MKKIVLAALLGIGFIFSANAEQDNGMIKLQSAHTVGDTVDRLEAVLKEKGMNIFARINHSEGAKKAGRLPSSIDMDWANCINYNGDKRLKTIDELENIFKTLNIEKTDPIILYCHSGVRSAHTTFVMTQLLGFENVKNYDGSWTEWSHFDDLPFESDHISLIKE